MSGHDPRFDRWDAAYVLGALSAADRRDYEEHLSDCPRCRAEVAELNGLPGLLSRVPGDRALELIGEHPTGPAAPSSPGVDAGSAEPTPPADLAERLERRHRARRRHRLLTTVGAGLAAAAVAVAVVLGVQSLAVGPSPTLVAELGPAAGGPPPEQLSASVRLYAKAWGTEVDTECRHQVRTGSTSTVEGDERYGLFLIDADGNDTLVSSWRGIPKSPIDTTAATAVRITQMKRLELRSLPDDTVLLSRDLPG